MGIKLTKLGKDQHAESGTRLGYTDGSLTTYRKDKEK